MRTLRQRIQQLLSSADIEIDGSRPWDIQIHNQSLFSRVVKEGSLGLGEAYMDGWWNVEYLDEFFYRLLNADIETKSFLNPSNIGLFLKSVIQNPQAKHRAHEIGSHHYDTGNDLFRAMLDKRMVYTCGYWLDGADTLDKAQKKKLDTVCQQLDLEPDDHILDIGCGWGSFAKFAAKNYDVNVTGLTVSEEQKRMAEKRCKDYPVEIRLQDYRELDERFDHIVSLGMFEHVGVKNYRTYMKTAHNCLADDGVFVLHTIGGNHSVHNTDPWIEKYIFPNSMIPSVRQIGLAIEDLFILNSWDNFGAHYDRTLMAWYQNFQDHWNELDGSYSEEFYRMWEYYLMCSAGSFRAQKNHQWQIVLTK